jgi:hypothetical protein
MKKILSTVQGLYYIVAGIWPVLHIHSFMLITGPKTDIWLVYTVGLLSFSIGLTLLFLNRYRIPPVLNALSAMSFLMIDVYYALTDVISDVYLADAVLEFIFIVAAIVMIFSKRVDSLRPVRRVPEGSTD